MTYTPSKEAIEAALTAEANLLGAISDGSCEVLTAALTAAAPTIRAEALREAADEMKLTGPAVNVPESALERMGYAAATNDAVGYLYDRAYQIETTTKGETL